MPTTHSPDAQSAPGTIRRIVIVGGGTAGWMAAAALSKVLKAPHHHIVLVESDEIATVGVGEATIPMIRMFNDVVGIDETEFLRETNATFKLGIHFVDWRKPGSTYFHPFGQFGLAMDGIDFHAYFLRSLRLGGHPDFGRYNVETVAASQNRFARIDPQDRSGLPPVNYAFQLDASLYAAFLRKLSERQGVRRQEGKIVKVEQDPESGFVTSVHLEHGETIEGDLFVDCSGFRGLIIEETLKSGYEDWSRWLPCNRAVAVPTEKDNGPLTPYTRATAREAGWQWRIPLQHRNGNGYVFCDAYVSESEATERLLARLDGKPLKDPKVLRFTTGHRRQMWNRNVVALGLASGFLEPLESTSIHLVQAGIAKLLAMFPKHGVVPAVIERFNRDMLAEYENIKDFLIAHYHVTERQDTPFWDYCRNMDIPDSLAAKLDIFRRTGSTQSAPHELFKEPSWFAVLMGQGLMPENYHPIADGPSDDELKQRCTKVLSMVQARALGMPAHDAYIARTCGPPSGTQQVNFR